MGLGSSMSRILNYLGTLLLAVPHLDLRTWFLHTSLLKTRSRLTEWTLSYASNQSRRGKCTEKFRGRLSGWSRSGIPAGQAETGPHDSALQPPNLLMQRRVIPPADLLFKILICHSSIFFISSLRVHIHNTNKSNQELLNLLPKCHPAPHSSSPSPPQVLSSSQRTSTMLPFLDPKPVQYEYQRISHPPLYPLIP